ncbi:MAG: DUF2974 domain-containing protein [Methylococcales bacterium]|nr:DUF2974 domain-containing protein [Methylococcales bacterium]
MKFQSHTTQKPQTRKQFLLVTTLISILGSVYSTSVQANGCDNFTAPATMVDSTQLVCLRGVSATDQTGTHHYKATLKWLPENPVFFLLLGIEFDQPSATNNPAFDTVTGHLHLPSVDIPRTFGTERYTADLIYNPITNLFQVISSNIYNNPLYSPEDTWKPYGMLDTDERRAVDTLGKSIPYANLASAVYDFDHTSVGDWQLIESKDRNSGMQSGVYQHNQTNELVIAFRGTQSCKKFSFSCSLKESYLDLAADALITVGKADEQFEHAFNYANEVITRYPDRKITMTGHSLGGSLAQAIGASLEKEVFVFNSAPVPEDFFSDHPSALSVDELYNSIFILADIHDPISNTFESTLYHNASHITPLLQFNFDKREVMPDELADVDALRLNKHGINVFINNATALMTLYSQGW